MKPTTIAVQLPNKLVTVGVLEDIPIKVEDLVLYANFMVMEIEHEAKVDDFPSILERPFLATAGTKIVVKAGTFFINILNGTKKRLQGI